MTGETRERAPAKCLAIFAKPAVTGRVKTRLIGELTAEQAAELHGAFLADLVDKMARGRFDLRVAWALEPEDSRSDLGADDLIQRGTDLGERLHEGLTDMAHRYPLVAAVGSDHPHLAVSLVEEAFDKLAAGAEVVLGPAGDGGYYLVGVRAEALRRELFAEIPWSSSAVLQTTLERCQSLGMRAELLAPVSDVDTPEDLDRLISSLARDTDIECPRTRALLALWGRHPAADSRGDSHEDP